MLGVVDDLPDAEAPVPRPVVADGDVPSSDEPTDDPDPPDDPVGPGAPGRMMAPFGRLLFGTAAVEELDVPALPGRMPTWRRTWPTAAVGDRLPPPLRPTSSATPATAVAATTRAAVRRARGDTCAARPGDVGADVPARSARSRNSVRRNTRRSGLRAPREVARTRSSGSPPSPPSERSGLSDRPTASDRPASSVKPEDPAEPDRLAEPAEPAGTGCSAWPRRPERANRLRRADAPGCPAAGPDADAGSSWPATSRLGAPT